MKEILFEEILLFNRFPAPAWVDLIIHCAVVLLTAYCCYLLNESIIKLRDKKRSKK